MKDEAKRKTFKATMFLILPTEEKAAQKDKEQLSFATSLEYELCQSKHHSTFKKKKRNKERKGKAGEASSPDKV